MAVCQGRQKTRNLCGMSLFRCKKCGSVGCKQPGDHQCTNQAFTGTGRCYKCGSMGQYETFK